MAMEMFLRVDGVAGLTSNAAHKGWSNVQSWQWGVSRSVKQSKNGPQEALNINRISIVKPVAFDSPQMMKLLVERTVIASAQISVAPAVGRREKPKKYIEIALENVLIQSIDTVSDTEGQSLETIVLIFNKLHYEYFHNIDESGGTPSSTETQSFSWSSAA